MEKFRDLRADEIDCRVAIVKDSGVSILLYKDARCDMNILDEAIGITNWKRHHEVINGNLFCTVEVWDEVKNPTQKKKKDRLRMHLKELVSILESDENCTQHLLSGFQINTSIFSREETENLQQMTGSRLKKL